MKVGDKVRYTPQHWGIDEWENGIIKEIPEHTPTAVRVVYHCDERWDRYMDYTGALTNISDLRIGWRP